MKRVSASVLPNALTFFRILLIPPVVALFFIEAPWARWVTLALFVIASATDWLDGYLARKLAVVSPLGRFLDPIADKLLIAAVLVMLAGVGDLPGVHLLAAVLILLRELLVSGLREYLSEKGVVVAVTKLAKWKTTMQMAALSLLIVAPVLGQSWLQAGWALIWLATALTLLTGWGYLKDGLKHMRSA